MKKKIQYAVIASACFASLCLGKAMLPDGSPGPSQNIQSAEREYAEQIIREMFARPASSAESPRERDRFRNVLLADFSVFDEEILSSVFRQHAVEFVLGRQGDQDVGRVLQLAADVACAGYRRAFETWASISTPEGPTNQQHLVVTGLSKLYPGSNGVLHIEDHEEDQRLYAEAVRELELRREKTLEKSRIERKLRGVELRYRLAFHALMERLSPENAEQLKQHLTQSSDDQINFLQVFEIAVEPDTDAK